MGRITVDGTISQFSCKMTVPPNLWDTKAGRLTGKTTLAVPIETVSRMMGHTHIKTTQIYARITKEKISQDMDIHYLIFQSFQFMGKDIIQIMLLHVSFLSLKKLNLKKFYL